MVIGGLIAGLFGSVLGLGGGILIIPMLTLVFGVPIKEAVGTSLICVIATSCGAASLYVKKHMADIRLGMTLELATTIGAIVGGLVAGFIESEVLAILFSLLLLYIAFSMSRRRAEMNFESDSSIPEEYPIMNLPLGMGASFFAGNISGLLGVGGGVIKVPTMYLLMGIPLKIAAATSNFMIGVTAAAGAFVYYARGEVDLFVTGSTMIGVFFGALIGSRILHLIKTEYLKKAFIIVLLYLSVEMLFKGLHLHFLF
ncbi:MAG: hypothetical protein AMJ73_04700 [candidate division Zixibacteria bacterium SM1_73]|nr:MAG: hypothetical protein AMJ73_04700 [candidate division Zixibacteria bacterium SM1_73]